ncbi:MAG: DUF922 domain-containing protein [Limisphaerales bacterium]
MTCRCRWNWMAACAGAVLALLDPWPTQAQHRFLVQTNYYAVTGETVREIRQSMNAGRPGGRAAKTDALTTWTIRWRSQGVPGPEGWRLSHFSTDTTITFTLPMWRAPTNAAPEVRAAWSRYFTALLRHELGHAEFGRQAAMEVQQKVAGLGPEPSAHALRERVRQTVEAIIADHRRREVDYDQRTDHGRKEGAQFP